MKDVTVNISEWNDMSVPMTPNTIYEIDFGEKIGRNRKVHYKNPRMGFYFQALDCTHPMQNTCLDGCNPLRWRPFIENRVEVEDAALSYGISSSYLKAMVYGRKKNITPFIRMYDTI